MRLTLLASLSSVAAMLLHCGTFVAANPTFTPHENDGSQVLDQCQGFSVTYPVGQGLVFPENTNRLVAWKAPEGISNVNITLAKADQTPVAVIGTFDANLGSAGEVPVSLNGQEPGEYHFHLEGIGMNCQADSSNFQVTSNSQTSLQQTDDKLVNAVAGATHQDSPYFTNEDRRTHVDQNLSDELNQLQQKHSNQAGHDDANQWQTEEIDDTDNEPVHQDAVGWTEDHENVEGFQEEEIASDDNEPAWIAEPIPSSIVGHTDAVENWSAEALKQENEPSGKVGTGYLPSTGGGSSSGASASHTNGNTIPVLPAEALIANW
ncbi:hypothetical protein VTP01DRAFT_1679 [Rhizomucor pusillus]|uniref:uncharacterized protein n=1 Tax=Rhizomucor pusillus TaxID=4840 RepID=UPI003743CAEF